MKSKILIFGGTTEGRVLASKLTTLGIEHVVSVATEYGSRIEENSGENNLFVGRKKSEEIEEILKNEEFLTVVDATHPFATDVTRTIKKACSKTGIRYIRLSRNTKTFLDKARKLSGFEDNLIFVTSIEEAVNSLEKEVGNILLMTGSKDILTISNGISDKQRIYARVLPNSESLSKCEEAGVFGKHIIAMQGPFSKQMNEALIMEINAKVILTKESGKAGGFSEKIEAARELGIKVVVIRNPEVLSGEEGYDLDETVEILKNLYGRNQKSIVLAGIGPGNRKYYTNELIEELQKADIIFGAKSVIERLEYPKFSNSKEGAAKIVKTYDAYEILSYLENHTKYVNPVIVYSGDISLCSGAKKALEAFTNAEYEVKKVSGISSLCLFAGKLGIALEDSTVVSSHGRKCNVEGYVRKERKLFVLPSDIGEAREIYKTLEKIYGKGHDNKGINKISFIAGINLGSESEVIRQIGCIEDFENLTGKIILFINNDEAFKKSIIPSIADDNIIRGQVPMTKEEIRALSIAKLHLTKNATLYDIGAGTGSISIEASLLSPSIEVYAIEKKREAVKLLEENRQKFAVSNMHIVEKAAPKAFENLPVPTHAFIGGSSGCLEEIIETLIALNKEIRIVVNCVTLETLTKVLNMADNNTIQILEIVQVNVCRYKKVGKYHMADAVNPVYIIVIKG